MKTIKCPTCGFTTKADNSLVLVTCPGCKNPIKIKN